jgi:hypothetical protein
MLLSEDQRLIVSTLGWCDAGSLWILETRSAQVSTCQISAAKYLTLHTGMDGHFSVVHHYDSNRLCISAHSLSDPCKPIARVCFGPSGANFEGESRIWRYVPKAYVAYFERPALSDFHLFLIEPTRPQAEIDTLGWYDESYDKGYQGVVDVVEVPGEDKLIFSVQRDSCPVLYDLRGRKVITRLSLANRLGGNPTLRFRRRAHELWANDYDTLLRIDPSDWHVTDSLLLQDSIHGSRCFIGEFCFGPDESLCAVPRPFSADVVALDAKRFRISHTCKLGREPLVIAVLTNGTVYGRDWKTGAPLKGRLKKKWMI